MVCFLTLTSIKKNFKTLDAYNRASNCRKAMFLNVADNILRKLSKTPNGRIHFQEFLDESTHIFKYHRHCHKVYKTGKRFSRNSWFELDAEWLAENFKEENFNTATCGFLTKEYHKWIDKRVYGYGNDGHHGHRGLRESRGDGKPEIGVDAGRGADRGRRKALARPVAKPVHDSAGKTEHPVDDMPVKPFADKRALQQAIDATMISVRTASVLAAAQGDDWDFRRPPEGREFTVLDWRRNIGFLARLLDRTARALKVKNVPEKLLTDSELQLEKLRMEVDTELKK